MAFVEEHREALKHLEEYDPFESFEHVQGAVVRNPYSRFAEFRRQGPVHKGSIWKLFGLMEPMPNFYGAEVRWYSTVTYKAVAQVLRFYRYEPIFSSRIYANTMGLVMGHSLLEMDEPEHGRYRELIESAFSRKAMERWEAEIFRPLANALIDRFADRGQADLVRQFTFRYPIHVITGLLGLPTEDLPQFHRWAIELINVAGDPPRGLAASQNLHDYLIGITDQRRQDPRDDLISHLAHAELDGHRLNDEEICAFLRLLLPAGAETTYRAFGNLLFGLLTHPEQLAAVRRDRSLIPQAIEEGLRWETPLTNIVRVTTKDTEIAGVAVPAGAAINVCTASANHDETHWPDPEEFNIFRRRLPHLSFGSGPHVCLGQHLARIEMTVALNALLDRLPNLRLDPEAEDPHITGLVFRSPTSLPVLFGI